MNFSKNTVLHLWQTHCFFYFFNMTRPPKLSDKEYIKFLEAQLSSQDTTKKFFRGIQRQMDILSDELLAEEFKVSFKTEYEFGKDGKLSKRTNTFEAFFDMLVKGKQIVDSMAHFEIAAYPAETVSGQVINKKHIDKIVL